ncbi:hypothetical protein TARUN_5326 [Trichoderma arundinaceum]|uniref:Uncharacterized protein n=1 Tax=Trichoderma arundinaceum TaxID=490622 RepID=A0A395NM13_TRIAR|nr:hypothetical protein TARUN_5326 [Trichoderma arundinaceum]
MAQHQPHKSNSRQAASITRASASISAIANHNGAQQQGHATGGPDIGETADPRDVADLVVPYQEPSVKGEVTDFSSTLSSTLPMAAMFMRNKFVGWIAVVFSIQTWLGESEDSKKSNGTPGYFSVGMSFMALAVTYLPMFIPPPGAQKAPPPAPLQ